jgi:cytochrome c
MKILLPLVSTALLLSLAPVEADQALAMKSGCLGCHKADARLVGPSFQEIAGKYQGDPSMVDSLAAKVKSGSPPGDPLVWGQIPMPANPSAPEDIKTVIRWMMAEGAK